MGVGWQAGGSVAEIDRRNLYPHRDDRAAVSEHRFFSSVPRQYAVSQWSISARQAICRSASPQSRRSDCRRRVISATVTSGPRHHHIHRVNQYVNYSLSVARNLSTGLLAEQRWILYWHSRTQTAKAGKYSKNSPSRHRLFTTVEPTWRRWAARHSTRPWTGYSPEPRSHQEVIRCSPRLMATHERGSNISGRNLYRNRRYLWICTDRF